MKYKIGNVEVEAVQWNGDLQILGVLRGKNVRYKYTIDSGNQLYLDDTYVIRGEYVVVISGQVHVFSEEDFNNMATKVKEPKFKVGDKAYCIRPNEISFHIIYSIVDDDEYLLEGLLSRYDESELLTLEEAIEKLKEL